MFKPGWYHTGMDSWDNPEIEYFANGPGFADRAFEHGPFESFSRAKEDLVALLMQHREYVKEAILKAKAIKKMAITFKDLTR